MHLADALGESVSKTVNFAKILEDYLEHTQSEDGRQTTFRASQMFYTCPREYWFQWWHPRKTEKKFSAAEQLKMMMGTYLHSYFQDYLFGPLGLVHGKWKSDEGKVVGPSFHPDPSSFGNGWSFVEEKISINGINGHHDGIISLDRLREYNAANIKTEKDLWGAYEKVWEMPLGETAILEIKTVSSRVYEMFLAGTIAEYYQMQTSIYSKGMNIPRIAFLYVDRDEFRFCLKLYDAEDRWVNEATRKVDVINKGIETKTIPENGVCANRNCTRAKKCPFRKECFDVKFNAEEWIKTSEFLEESA